MALVGILGIPMGQPICSQELIAECSQCTGNTLSAVFTVRFQAANVLELRLPGPHYTIPLYIPSPWTLLHHHWKKC